jgi:hypothetical protein
MLDPQLSAQISELGIDPATIEVVVSGAVYLTIVSVVTAIPTGIIAKRKNRSSIGWVTFALCVPLLPLIIVWLMPSKKGK